MKLPERLKDILDVIMNEVKHNKGMEMTLSQPFEKAVDYPVIYCFLHYASLNQAEKLLQRIPDKECPTYHFLNDFYHGLREAENQRCVFPLDISYRDWDKGPHLYFPFVPILWLAARVEGRYGNEIFIVCRNMQTGSYGEIEPTVEEFQNANISNINVEDVKEGTFLEMAYEDDNLYINIHSKHVWSNPYRETLLKVIQPWVDNMEERFKEFQRSFYPPET